jgi:hypothetical protein
MGSQQDLDGHNQKPDQGRDDEESDDGLAVRPEIMQAGLGQWCWLIHPIHGKTPDIRRVTFPAPRSAIPRSTLIFRETTQSGI